MIILGNLYLSGILTLDEISEIAAFFVNKKILDILERREEEEPNDFN